MDNQMVELCAKALWDRSQQDIANQYKYRHVARKQGPITWKEISDIDIIPSVANEYRESVRIVISALRRYIYANSKDAQSALDLFYLATAKEE